MRTSGHNIRIAIIGGGASGTIAAIQLLRKLNVDAQIVLIEQNKALLYRGAAYSSTLPYAPLNVQAERMSIFNHLPDDFYNWLKDNREKGGQQIARHSFVSRRWFGDYLQDRVQQAQRYADHAKLEVIMATVENIEVDVVQHRYVLQLSGEEPLEADYLIFATGNEAPQHLFNRDQVKQLGHRYIENPWQADALKKIEANRRVLILGTGLTAVDFIVSLEQLGHRGKICSFSRRGLFPLIHTTTQNYVFDMNEEPHDLHDALNVIKANIASAQSMGVAWQNVLDAMRVRTPRIWRKLSTESKRTFLKKFRLYWDIHRHRMPQTSADIMAQMAEAGKLEITAGSFDDVAINENGVLFTYNNRGDRVKKRMEADVVINCIGPSTDYHQCNNNLIKNLLNKGWAVQDELKLGIVTGIRGEIIKNNGVVLQNAFCVGPLRRAMEWESTAMREIRTQAEQIAMHIASSTEQKHEIMVDIGI